MYLTRPLAVPQPIRSPCPDFCESSVEQSWASESTNLWVCAQLRDYEDGVLVREEPIPEEQLEAVLGKRAAPVKRRHRRARAKVKRRRMTAATPLAGCRATVHRRSRMLTACADSSRRTRQTARRVYIATDPGMLHVHLCSGHCTLRSLWLLAAQGPKRPGERIYKGHKSYDLMLNLQLGIRYSVGGVQARPSVPMLLPTDFQDTVRFSLTAPPWFLAAHWLVWHSLRRCSPPASS